MFRDFEIEEIVGEAIPEKLQEIPQAPTKLFVRGALPDPSAKVLAVVGSRAHSPYGRDVCERLIRELSGYNICIVSGLALGIDAIAHRAALDAGLHTVAIPGSGLAPSVLYPRSHAQLAEKILRSGGALLSEFAPDFRATVWSFPQRNRIMAGIADAVLVIEAESKSGTLITSKYATEYNRDVLAVPGSIFSKHSDGPHMLIRLGATPIRNSNDILEALGFNVEMKQGTLSYDNCSEDELRVIKLLSAPCQKDELVRQLGLPVHEAIALISLLEIKGLIEERMGEIKLI